MNILVPIQNKEDIAQLALAGANEMYCGYVPKWWIDEFNSLKTVGDYSTVPCNLNNRNALKSNFTDLSDLAFCVNQAKKNGVNLFLTLNAKYFPQMAYPFLKKWLDEVSSVGVEKLIVSDFGLIHWLNKNYSQFSLSTSCLSQITNSESIRFCLEFENVERVVFPRHISVNEAIELAKAFPKTEFEFFGLSNKCQYDDGYCRGIHDFFPVCKDIWDNDYYSLDDENIPYSTQDLLINASQHFNRWAIGYPNSKLCNYRWKGVACSLCSICNLISLENVVSVKLAGRGYELSERIKQVKIATQIIELAQSKNNVETIKNKVSNFFGIDDFCCGVNCIMCGKEL